MRELSRGLIPALRLCGLLAALWIVIGLSVHSTGAWRRTLAARVPRAGAGGIRVLASAGRGPCGLTSGCRARARRVAPRSR